MIYDYAIIGNGLAGLQLALKMITDPFFKDKYIVLIDPSKKNNNDKTWSFWETGHSQWNEITHQSWKKATVFTSNKTINLELSPYQYKTIKSIDFYNFSKTKLEKHKNVTFIIDEVLSVKEDNISSINSKTDSYKAKHVFDSRLPNNFLKHGSKTLILLQHFKGYIIKTETPSFNKDVITMMDYRIKDGHQTTFTYVLPFSKTEALVEFTYFTANLVSDDVYDTYIKTYIKNHLKIDNYSIIETEKGVIPMTNYPFQDFNTKHVTKIGTAGGWVKGSTGYSFKHTEKKVIKIIDNLKNNRLPSNLLFKKRFKFYDTIFLKVLIDENDRGEWIFEQFYSKNKIQIMFKFLDEESNFFEELKIMSSLFSWSFIKAFFKTR